MSSLLLDSANTPWQQAELVFRIEKRWIWYRKLSWAVEGGINMPFALMGTGTSMKKKPEGYN
jgi:hypothetical protein